LVEWGYVGFALLLYEVTLFGRFTLVREDQTDEDLVLPTKADA